MCGVLRTPRRYMPATLCNVTFYLVDYAAAKGTYSACGGQKGVGAKQTESDQIKIPAGGTEPEKGVR